MRRDAIEIDARKDKIWATNLKYEPARLDMRAARSPADVCEA